MSGTGRAQKSEAPDLTNVDYEDVLHLYRGWRKSESALKDKNKELTQLKQRVKQLQDSHTRFRGQIQALESVKELTISLQTQLSTVQQENSQLVHENRELQDLNKQAEQLLQDRSNAEKQQEKAFRDVQIEFAMLRGRYEELSISQKSLEEMTADEQVMRMTAESRLHSSEETTNALREEMRGLRMKLDSQTTRLHQSDQELAHASEQLSSLSREVAGLAKEREALATSEAENGILKGDIKRLLRLLEHYPAARGFLTRWNDSDDLSFVGVPAAATRGGHGHSGDAHNYPALEEGTITQSEVNHLKRLHGEDPFPVFDSFTEESDNWVPREAARLGMNFIASKIPHAPPSLILEFLRGMSKVWQKREERKFLRVQAQYEARLAEMKRKLDHAKPYKQKIQERQIKRLKYQALKATEEKLKGHSVRKIGIPADFRADVDTFDEPDVLDRVPPHMRRPCMLSHSHSHSHSHGGVNGSAGGMSSSAIFASGNFGGDAEGGSMQQLLANPYGSASPMRRSVDDVAAEKLLEASLISLEAIGRQRASGVHRAVNHGAGGGSDMGQHPNESYLNGAIWLGRNMMMVAEELADSLDLFRNKQLVEVAAAAQDADAKRSAHRLNLLAAAGITEAVALANTSKSRARQIFQLLSAIQPGDKASLEVLRRVLPIDSALHQAAHAEHPRSLLRHHAAGPPLPPY